MNEQIIITKNNNGIEIQVQFIDSKKKPVDLEGSSVEISFKDPNENITTTSGYKIDSNNGIVGIVLDESKTNTEGLWSSYWSSITEDGFVTGQEAIYYYVMPEYGGVSNEENN